MTIERFGSVQPPKESILCKAFTPIATLEWNAIAFLTKQMIKKRKPVDPEEVLQDFIKFTNETFN